MKKITLITFICVMASHLFAGETVLLDFESATVPSSISSWLNYSKAGPQASTWGATNPLLDEINGTNGCYKIVKGSGDPYWTGLEVVLNDAIPITSENQYLHVLIYKNTDSRIALTYTNAGGTQSSDVWQANATTGEWIDYVLEIPTATSLKKISIKIGDDAEDYYFDQITLSNSGTSLSRTVVAVSGSQKGQVMEGWGASLCWWANMMGAFPDARIKTICDWITDPERGMNMNVFRFNIGGGDDPEHNHMRSDGGAMPGYKASANADYDWSQDANQRKILQQLIASRIEKAGVNDIQVIGFSNSPPYWMTHSGCSSGSVEGNVTNLKADMYDDFADYLTEVTKYYHDTWGITFNFIEPFNEPGADWWKALGGQEGCHFSEQDQILMIRELYTKLEEKEMLSYCRITANDDNHFDGTYSALQRYQDAGDILSKLDLVSVHTYGGDNRGALYNWAKNNNKKLWQTESGPLYVGGTGTYEDQIMIMADRIITDLRDLKCTVWCDWQIGGSGSLSSPWALIVGDYNDMLSPVQRNTNFHIRSQFSRFIKADYTIVQSSAANSVVALSPDEKELVVVISNRAEYIKKFKVDLSEFSEFGKVKQFRTRAQESYNIKVSEDRFDITGTSFTYDAQPQTVTTFIIPIGNQSTAVEKNKKREGGMYFSGRRLYTNFIGEESANINVVSLSGQTIQTYNNIPAQGSLNLSLKNGMYLIYARVGNTKIVEKIVVANN